MYCQKLLALLALTSVTIQSNPSFRIDYENDQFLLDGKPFRYISGSIHYFRIPKEYWLDGLKKVRALGFSAIQFFIPWNFHEPIRGEYNFGGNRNFSEFIQLAASQGLWSIVRLGPYSCGEIENGGLPWWLINEVKKFRSSDMRFKAEVRKYWNVLLPIVKPLLRKNGGPILTVQIENEYGSYDACDRNYTMWLRDFVWREFGNDVVIHTTDGHSDHYLKCGYVPKTLPTVDFGPGTDVKRAISAIRKYLPKGPLVNSEYYAGWIQLWGQKENSLPTVAQFIQTITEMYRFGFNINIYMIHGGSNWEFSAGAEVNAPVLQSYDFSAPISEGGDTNTTYYLAIRDWIAALPDWKQEQTPFPPNLPKHAYGTITFKYSGGFGEQKYGKCLKSSRPLTFEDMRYPVGYVIYSKTLDRCGFNLTIPSFADFTYIHLGSKLQGTLTRTYYNISTRSLRLHGCIPGSRLDIIVENQGRQTYESILDHKGILSDVILDGKVLRGWKQCGLDLNPHPITKISKVSANGTGFFVGSLYIRKEDPVVDTFIDTTGWGKGVVVVNGFNLGRYWATEGPQMTLYVPASRLKRGKNTIMVVQMLGPAGYSGSAEKNNRMTSVDHAIFKWKSKSKSERTAKRHPSFIRH